MKLSQWALEVEHISHLSFEPTRPTRIQDLDGLNSLAPTLVTRGSLYCDRHVGEHLRAIEGRDARQHGATISVDTSFSEGTKNGFRAS